MPAKNQVYFEQTLDKVRKMTKLGKAAKNAEVSYLSGVLLRVRPPSLFLLNSDKKRTRRRHMSKKMLSMSQVMYEKYGPYKALIIHHIAFWIVKNRKADRNYHKDQYWTYLTAKDIGERLNMSESKARRHVRELEEAGVIASDNFNRKGYDNTKWYTIIDETALQIYMLNPPKLEASPSKNEGPIPYSEPYSEPDNQKEKKKVETYFQRGIREATKRIAEDKEQGIY